MLRKLIVGLLASTVLGIFAVPTALGAHRNPVLQFRPGNEVNIGDAVTVAAWDDSTNGDVHIDECRVEGVRAASTACDTDAGGTGSWVNVASKNNTDELGPNGESLAPAAYQAPTNQAGTFGYRARSAHDRSIGDLTVNALTETQRSNGCNGIENALTKVKENSNAKNRLTQIATEKFNCDIGD